MTIIVGILCEDGVVIASDSHATFGTGFVQTIGRQNVRKIYDIEDQILYTSTGAVGISQLIIDQLRRSWQNKIFKNNTPEQAMDRIGKDIGQLLGGYLHSGTFQKQLVGNADASLCKSIVAMPVNSSPCLMQFDFNGAPERATEDLPFVTLGSGQPIADPFLATLKRLLWQNRKPTLAEARMAAAWTVDNVRQNNPGGVGGRIQLASLERKRKNEFKIEKYDENAIEEHRQHIAVAEEALVQAIRRENSNDDYAADIPEPPEEI